MKILHFSIFAWTLFMASIMIMYLLVVARLCFIVLFSVELQIYVRHLNAWYLTFSFIFIAHIDLWNGDFSKNNDNNHDESISSDQINDEFLWKTTWTKYQELIKEAEKCACHDGQLFIWVFDIVLIKNNNCLICWANFESLWLYSTLEKTMLKMTSFRPRDSVQ